MSENVRWNIIDIIKVFMFYFLTMQVGIPAFLWFIELIFGLDLLEVAGDNIMALSMSLLVNILTCLYIIYIIHEVYGLSIKSLGFTSKDWKIDVWFGLKRYFLVLPIIILAGYIIDYVFRLFGLEPEQQVIISKVLEEDSVTVLIFMCLFGMLAAPVIEELLFRGFFQPVVRAGLGKRKAILISASIFAFVHLDAHIFLQIFILGLLLAYLYEKTGSLIASITVHIFHNSVTLALLFTLKYLFEDYV